MAEFQYSARVRRRCAHHVARYIVPPAHDAGAWRAERLYLRNDTRRRSSVQEVQRGERRDERPQEAHSAA